MSTMFGSHKPEPWLLVADLPSTALPICDGAVGAEVGLGAIGVVFRYFHDLGELAQVQLDAEITGRIACSWGLSFTSR